MRHRHAVSSASTFFHRTHHSTDAASVSSYSAALHGFECCLASANHAVAPAYTCAPCVYWVSGVFRARHVAAVVQVAVGRAASVATMTELRARRGAWLRARLGGPGCVDSTWAMLCCCPRAPPFLKSMT